VGVKEFGCERGTTKFPTKSPRGFMCRWWQGGSFETSSDGMASSTFKGLGSRVNVSMPAEPVHPDDVVAEIGVVCVGKTGSFRFKIKANGDTRS